MSSWDTKRDGYRTTANNINPLGRPVPRLEPSAGHTHVIIIPGLQFKMVLSEATMTAKVGKISKVDFLLKSLAKTTVAGPGKRRVKAAPVLLTVEEFHALNNTVKAA